MLKKDEDPGQPSAEEGGSGLQPQPPFYANMPGWSYPMPQQRTNDQSKIKAAMKESKSSRGYAKRSFNMFRNMCHDYRKNEPCQPTNLGNKSKRTHAFEKVELITFLD
jgi:hypothetical protein